MPRGSPFTRLCESVFQPAPKTIADLHLHTNKSDGDFSPQHLVHMAWGLGLTALAITDHDTLAGIPVAIDHCQQKKWALEIIPGVEMTCELHGQELHLLGYFVDVSCPELNAQLQELRQERFKRYTELVQTVRGLVDWWEVVDYHEQPIDFSLGKRHIARALINSGSVATFHQAFQLLNEPRCREVPKVCCPIEKGIALIRQAGGVCSWAHPDIDKVETILPQLVSFGLQALECEYPWSKGSIAKKLREYAQQYNLFVTGGSDCHGMHAGNRYIGKRGISLAELELLRAASNRPKATD